MKTRVIEIVVKAKDQASAKMKGLSGAVGGAGAAVAALGVAATVAAAAMVAAFTAMVKSAIATVAEMSKVGDQFDKMSARTSIAADDLIEWTFLMERAGGTAGSLEAAVRRLTKSMYDKSVGLSTAVRAWEDIGVATTDANGNLRDVNDVLLDLADALSKMENKTEALGLSQDLLGRGAAQMVALLAQGRPELERQAELFKAINGQMGEEFTKGAAAVIDAQTDLKYSIQGLKADLVKPIQPILAETIDEIAIAVGGFGEYVEANQDEIKEFATNLASVTTNMVELGAEALKFSTGAGKKLAELFEILPRPLVLNIQQIKLFNAVLKELQGEAESTGSSVAEMVANMGSGLDINLRPNVGGTGAESVAAPLVDTLRASFEKEADDLGVDMFTTVFDPSTGNWAQVDKSLEELAKELTTKLNAALNLRVAAAPVIPKEVEASMEGYIEGLNTELMLLEDIQAAEEERSAKLAVNNDAELQALLDQEEVLRRHLEIKAEQEKQEEEETERQKEQAERQQVLDDALNNVRRSVEQLGASSIASLLKGEQGAISFGRALKNIVIDALSQVIAKLIIIQALNALGSLVGAPAAGSTAQNIGLAHGGKIQRAANGFAVPDGPRGRDSVLIAAMPGEEVITRGLSGRLDSFLAAQSSSSMVSPLALSGGGGGGGSVVANLNIGRPVGFLDLLDLGEHAKYASEKIAEVDF